MDFCYVSKVCGFLGDGLTFAGGFILALEALMREREFFRKKNWGQTVAILKKARITKNGVILTDDADVELAFIRQTATRALVGTVVLTLGFVCLFLSRLFDALCTY